MIDLLTLDPVALTAALVDVPSVSHEERPLADTLEQALRLIPGVEVLRHENSLVARTQRGLPQRMRNCRRNLSPYNPDPVRLPPRFRILEEYFPCLQPA